MNDACGSATTIGVGTQSTVDTRAATTAPSDPPQACTGGGPSTNAKSVWFRYTPPSSGSVIVNTVGSNYDTVLTAYTGSCGALIPVACDDDGAVALLSRLQFNAAGGTPYLIEATAKGVGAPGGMLHLLVAQFASSPVPTATSQGVPTGSSADAKALDACQQAIKKAGAKLVSTTLKSLATCGDRLVKCIQTKADSGQRDACVTSAAPKCGKDVAKAEAARSTFQASVLKRCGTQVSIADMRGGNGLGFDDVVSACSGSADSVAAIATCVAGQHQCEAASLFEATEPRARELMRVAGVNPGAFASLACLTDHGGGGQDLDQEATTGKLLEKCAKAATKAGATYAAKKLKSLETCVDKRFTCVTTKAGDASCPAKADSSCARQLVTIAGAESTLRAALAKSCGGLDYSTVLAAAVGADLDALAGECSSFGVAAPTTFAAYVDCVARQHACRVESLLRFEAPRASELLAGVNPPITFPSAQCPAP